MNSRTLHTLCTLFTMLLLAPALQADAVSEAADRIRDRLQQIDTLKAAGDVGEDARGYLSARKPLGPRQDSLLQAENADRRTVYESVAQKTGQSLMEVERQRALAIATRANTGTWLQKPGGEWYQKQ